MTKCTTNSQTRKVNVRMPVELYNQLVYELQKQQQTLGVKFSMTQFVCYAVAAFVGYPSYKLPRFRAQRADKRAAPVEQSAFAGANQNEVALIFGMFVNATYGEQMAMLQNEHKRAIIESESAPEGVDYYLNKES